jgi:hypothetical protein
LQELKEGKRDTSYIQPMIEWLIIFEILFCFLRIITSLQVVLFKNNKGIANCFLLIVNRVQMLRLFNFMGLTYVLMSTEGRDCICHSRKSFAYIYLSII